MRLWHYKLIPYLPKKQLISQWRELNSIFKKQNKYILINYVYEYPKEDLYLYTEKVLKEMQKRQIRIKSYKNANNYFEELYSKTNKLSINIPFPNHHTDRYLLQCFYNLQEKYDRGQKNFTKEQYEKLCDFVNKELNLNYNL